MVDKRQSFMWLGKSHPSSTADIGGHRYKQVSSAQPIAATVITVSQVVNLPNAAWIANSATAAANSM